VRELDDGRPGPVIAGTLPFPLGHGPFGTQSGPAQSRHQAALPDGEPQAPRSGAGKQRAEEHSRQRHTVPPPVRRIPAAPVSSTLTSAVREEHGPPGGPAVPSGRISAGLPSTPVPPPVAREPLTDVSHTCDTTGAGLILAVQVP